MLPTPRKQHYDFAHRILPYEAHNRPERLWDSLTGPAWSESLAGAWGAAGQGAPEQLPVRGLSVEGVLSGDAVFREDGLEIVMVRMPPALAPGEAFWIVLIRKQGTTRPLRYFAFEKAAGEQDATIMSEWRADGSRINLGDAGDNLLAENIRSMAIMEALSEPAPANTGYAPPYSPATAAAIAAVRPVPGVDLSKPFVCELSTFHTVRMWLSMPLCGIGLIWWLIHRSQPEIIDPQGITLRSGARYTWDRLTDLKRVRVVGAVTGVRMDYYISLAFGGETVNVTPGDLNNGPQAIAYLEALLGTRLRDDY